MEDEARDKRVEKYPHVNIYEPPEHIDLLEGIKSCSIYAAGQKLFKSHFHMSLGVVLSMKEDLTSWGLAVPSEEKLFSFDLFLIEFDLHYSKSFFLAKE